MFVKLKRYRIASKDVVVVVVVVVAVVVVVVVVVVLVCKRSCR